ncbi:unnamed protein product, partial [Mesorhabditis belari]|uniref:Uncharacterized protein n=1 Tax=Mesorhabditis belari TaxID=2138241 RepID=A0AAF3FF44_9BILA
MERREIDSGAPSEEFFIAEESELEFVGSAPPSNIWPYDPPVDPRVFPRVQQWQRVSDEENERHRQLQHAMRGQQLAQLQREQAEQEALRLQRENNERSQPTAPLLGSGSGCREEDMEILSDNEPILKSFENCFTERSPTIISGSTKNLTKSILNRSMTSLQSLKNKESTVHKWLKRVCISFDFKGVNFLKATVIFGFVGLLVVLGYSSWPKTNPRGSNGGSMLRYEEFKPRSIEGNVTNLYWEGNELKAYIQYKSTYEVKSYDYELLQIQPAESYFLRSVMRQFQCEETRWVENFVCCYDPKYGAACASQRKNNDWMLIPGFFYRAEFLKKNEQDYLVAQERLNTMPYLMDRMGENISIKTHECGDAYNVLRFDITNEKIAIVSKKKLSRHKNLTSLLLIDPFDENDHKCFQGEEPSLDRLYGIWVDRDVVWMLSCSFSCSVRLLTLEGLQPIYYYPISQHGDFTVNSNTKKHDPRFVGKTENNYLNIYTFVNGNDSAKIIRKRLSFPVNNPKN